MRILTIFCLTILIIMGFGKEKMTITEPIVRRPVKVEAIKVKPKKKISLGIAKKVIKPVANEPKDQKEQWLMAAGIPRDQWNVAIELVHRESEWDPCAYNPGKSDCNYSGESACGLAQALPCSKLRNVCTLTDPVCHLKWQWQYVQARYGSYFGAIAWHDDHEWY